MANWITHLEAARLLGVSPTTIRQMLNRGDLERRPSPRDRGTPSVGAESVERLRQVREQRAAERAADEARRRLHRTPPDAEQVWLSAPEAAAVIGVSHQWVRARARQERIPATMHGGQWWVSRRHAEAIAAARAFSARADRP